MRSTLAYMTLAAAAGSASAQQAVWGQCGGIGYSGPTTCVSGSVCTYNNDWYSQCIPGTGAPPPVPTTTRTTTTTSVRPTTTTTSVRPPTTTVLPPPAGTGFPRASGTRFTIDGVTKYWAGTNCYWCTAGGISNADLNLVFDHLRSSGIKILRVWGFNDVNTIPGNNQVWFQHLSASGSTINLGDNGLGRIDAAVRAAERTGIKLIIPFVNNWDDYGGMKAYTNAFGGTHQQWYTNTAAQAQYRRYIQAVVSRHRNSNAILAWELGNEPRCQGCNTNVIHEWARTTSEYVKSLAPNHMVTLGDEGFGLPGESSYPYGYSEGTDWARLLQIRTLDFATFHLYPSHWGTTYDWGNKWVRDHAALCAAAGKPCFFEEYGTPERHCELERPWQRTSVAAAGMAGDAFWQHGDVLSTGRTHDDTFTIFYGSSDWTCLVTNHVAAIG